MRIVDLVDTVESGVDPRLGLMSHEAIRTWRGTCAALLALQALSPSL